MSIRAICQSARKRFLVVWEVGRLAQFLDLLLDLLLVLMVAAAAMQSSPAEGRPFTDFLLSTPFPNPLSLLDDHFQILLPDQLSTLLLSQTTAKPMYSCTSEFKLEIHSERAAEDERDA